MVDFLTNAIARTDFPLIKKYVDTPLHEFLGKDPHGRFVFGRMAKECNGSCHVLLLSAAMRVNLASLMA